MASEQGSVHISFPCAYHLLRLAGMLFIVLISSLDSFFAHPHLSLCIVFIPYSTSRPHSDSAVVYLYEQVNASNEDARPASSRLGSRPLFLLSQA